MFDAASQEGHISRLVEQLWMLSKWSAFGGAMERKKQIQAEGLTLEGTSRRMQQDDWCNGVEDCAALIF